MSCETLSANNVMRPSAGNTTRPMRPARSTRKVNSFWRPSCCAPSHKDAWRERTDTKHTPCTRPDTLGISASGYLTGWHVTILEQDGIKGKGNGQDSIVLLSIIGDVTGVRPALEPVRSRKCMARANTT